MRGHYGKVAELSLLLAQEVLEDVNEAFTNFDTSEFGGSGSGNEPINPVTGESSSNSNSSGSSNSNSGDSKNNNLVKSINTTVSTIKTEIQKLTKIINGNDGLKVEITNTPLKVDTSKNR